MDRPDKCYTREVTGHKYLIFIEVGRLCQESFILHKLYYPSKEELRILSSNTGPLRKL